MSIFNFEKLGVKPPKDSNYQTVATFRPLHPTNIGADYARIVKDTSVTRGASAYEIARLAGFRGSKEDWLDSLRGPTGKSAYELAVEYGFEGSEEDWLSSLIGKLPDGTSIRPDDGKSAYELAVDKGFTGTVDEYLDSLKGERGLSAYRIAVQHGFDGTELEWLDSLHGTPGLNAYELSVAHGFFNGTEEEWITKINTPVVGPSAYEIAVENGFSGNKNEWLASLKVVTKVEDGVEVVQLPGPKGDTGLSAYEIATQDNPDLLIEEWIETLQGEKGDPGEKGDNGLSAYELWIAAGNTGTVDEWLESLKGPMGPKGADGIDGIDGKDNYEFAVENGFNGTKGEFLDYIKGPKGDKGEPGTNGVDGTNGKNGKDGKDGKNAYEMAVENGYTGSMIEWMSALGGSDGEDGKSAYELALESGFTGSLQQWFDSMHGKNGKDGAPGLPGPQGEPGPQGPKGEKGLRGFKGRSFEPMSITVDPSLINIDYPTYTTSVDTRFTIEKNTIWDITQCERYTSNSSTTLPIITGNSWNPVISMVNPDDADGEPLLLTHSTGQGYLFVDGFSIDLNSSYKGPADRVMLQQTGSLIVNGTETVVGTYIASWIFKDTGPEFTYYLDPVNGESLTLKNLVFLNLPILRNSISDSSVSITDTCFTTNETGKGITTDIIRDISTSTYTPFAVSAEEYEEISLSSIDSKIAVRAKVVNCSNLQLLNMTVAPTEFLNQLSIAMSNPDGNIEINAHDELSVTIQLNISNNA